ncbi:SOS response associated peptidase (SRAP) [Acidocella aminolytica 101 = DSM 11237]|nr:SOS response associated peptidase (SRAP) [Acidocella aminolytica 101 = DSM 11237]
MFRAAFVHNRCPILADAYFELRIQPYGQHPYTLARRDGVPMMFVELWDIWKGTDGGKHRSFTLITTESNNIVRPCYDRMPVTVENEN